MLLTVWWNRVDADHAKIKTKGVPWIIHRHNDLPSLRIKAKLRMVTVATIERFRVDQVLCESPGIKRFLIGGLQLNAVRGDGDDCGTVVDRLAVLDNRCPHQCSVLGMASVDGLDCCDGIPCRLGNEPFCWNEQLTIGDGCEIGFRQRNRYREIYRRSFHWMNRRGH